VAFLLGIFLDSETNGLNPQIHRLVELAFKIVDLASGEVKETYQTLISQDLATWKQSDPESLKINGFTFEEASSGKPLKKVQEEVLAIFAKWDIVKKKAVFICQNPSFDRIFFTQLIPVDLQEKRHLPYHWLDLASMHWALAMKKAQIKSSKPPWELGYSKDFIASTYNLPAEIKPHRALNGVTHLLLCYGAVVGYLNPA
jgi:DNA polymerase-3 subunit epsilon/oligoribonuclease